ncbi:hypothetical protein V2J09_011977 [Rumex salicifolius]
MAVLSMRSTFFVSSFLIIIHIGSIQNVASELVFDSIYQFGDSLSDTGNGNWVSPPSSCDRSPYGQSYSKKPTGRCSDGLLMVDFIARALNLPLLDPYLQKDGNFTHGVNFAVAGATALNSSFMASKKFLSGLSLPASENSLSVQLGWFRTHLDSSCPSPSDCKKKFQTTLFMVGEIGGNDYNFPFSVGKSIESLKPLVPDVVQSISDAVKEVIDHGAVQLVVPGNFPIGCLPMYLNSFASDNSSNYDDLGCLKPLNEFAMLHNNQLQQSIKELQKQNPSVAIYYGDYYSAFTWVLQNAASLGFEKDALFKPCCGNMNQFCGFTAEVCSDPKKRISWDGIHLTQEMYRNLAHWLLLNTFPQAIPCCSDSKAVESSGAQVISVLLLQVVMVPILSWWAIRSKVF